jgi:dolichol-phosphate mannosyltransferase
MPPRERGPLSIIIPVFNEGQNFPALWGELTAGVKSPFTANVVYDFDEDDTVPVVASMIEGGERRLRLVKNQIKRGVVGAISTGFQVAPAGPLLVLMADCSDDVEQIDRMLNQYYKGADVVVGSRYMKGGKLIGGPWFKQFLSRMSGLTLHWLRGLPTHDATNAFKIYDGEMVRGFSIESSGGFELNLELTVKAFLAGNIITEVPVSWRDRSAGKSKFKLWRWLPKYLRWYFYAFQPRHSPRRVQST